MIGQVPEEVPAEVDEISDDFDADDSVIELLDGVDIPDPDEYPDTPGDELDPEGAP